MCRYCHSKQHPSLVARQGKLLPNSTCDGDSSSKGFIDVSAEEQRLTKKEQTALKLKANLEKKMSNPGYEDNVPADVKAQNLEKVSMHLAFERVT